MIIHISQARERYSVVVAILSYVGLLAVGLDACAVVDLVGCA